MSTLPRQGAWAFVDQVLSSGTNFVPSLLLARELGPAGFGGFSLAFLTWFGALGLLRNAIMQPYTLAAASLEGPEWRDITRNASGMVLIAGGTVGGVFVVISVIIGISSGVGQAFLVVGLLAPGLALQEFWRVASFAAQRARTATANDGIWALGQLAAFALVLSTGKVTVAGGLIAWGAPAWVAAGFGIRQLSVMPRVNRSAIRWARKWMSLGSWFTATNLTFTLGYLAIAIIIAADIGSAGLGLFRAVQQNLFGPVQLLTIGAESVFLPHLVRTIKRTRASGLRDSALYSLMIAGATAVYGVVLLFVAHTVLSKVFGTAFTAATVLVLPMLVAFSLDAISDGAELLLRAYAMGSRVFVAQLAATSARITAVAVLVGVDGLSGAGWGLVIGGGVSAAALWIQVALATVHKRLRVTTDEYEPLWWLLTEPTASLQMHRPSSTSSGERETPMWR